MLQSMTGFGQGQCERAGFQASVEVKALNSRNLDLNVRIPREFSAHEVAIRKQVGDQLIRGKINLVAEVRYTRADQQQRPLNRALIRSYYQDIAPLSDELGLSKAGLLNTLLGFPDVFEQPESGDGEAQWAILQEAIDEALQQLQEFRQQEGQHLQTDLKRIGQSLHTQKQTIAEQAQTRLTQTRDKLWERLQRHLPAEARDQVDHQRFEQEVLYYLEKIDVTEELDRLDSHLQYFFDNLDSDQAGRRLNFISQELGREINTIGSKISDTAVQQEVVHMKEHLEQIKEQVQNIL